ncbi:BAF_collapsed_G0053700.mRNA.1.CDS.1 [Saccharomyces cerevisiae]|nr:BAF_collapsed_G0053700.mRNA.1.CDS.1 [Saccharomyces cerevisiae]
MIQREEMNMPRQYSEQQQLQENEGEGENTRLPVSEEEFRMVQELQAIQAGHDQANLPPSGRECGNNDGGADEWTSEEYDVFRNVGQGLVGHYKEIMIRYWQELINEIESTNEPG